jgi:hypothetical protein
MRYPLISIVTVVYNGAEKKCYISRNPQIKPPILAAYSHEYNLKNIIITLIF